MYAYLCARVDTYSPCADSDAVVRTLLCYNERVARKLHICAAIKREARAKILDFCHTRSLRRRNSACVQNL
jgi:hypothetical protein